MSRRDRGASTAEIAVVLPAAYLLIFSVIQFGVWAYASHVAHTTADTALAAARADGGTTELAHSHAVVLLDQLAGGGLLVEPEVTINRTESQATVRVEGTAATVVPGLTLPVIVELSGPVERFVPVEGG